jgi:hypothetical protein
MLYTKKSVKRCLSVSPNFQYSIDTHAPNNVLYNQLYNLRGSNHDEITGHF